METLFGKNDQARPVAGTTDPLSIEPPDDWVLVKLDEKQEKSKGGIQLLASDQAIPRSGVIISQGPGTLLEDGVSRMKMHAAKGNVVLFEPAAGKRIPQLEGHILMRNGSICAVIHGKEVEDLTAANVTKHVAPVSDFLLIRTDRPNTELSRKVDLMLPRRYAEQRFVDERELCISGRVVKRGPGLEAKGGARAPGIASVGQRVLLFEPALWWSIPNVHGHFLAPERGCVPGVLTG